MFDLWVNNGLINWLIDWLIDWLINERSIEWFQWGTVSFWYSESLRGTAVQQYRREARHHLLSGRSMYHVLRWIFQVMCPQNCEFTRPPKVLTFYIWLQNLLSGKIKDSHVSYSNITKQRAWTKSFEAASLSEIINDFWV